MNNFKNISFVLKDIDYEFVLTYKDLFIEKNNEYIFLIAFDHNVAKTSPIWILGKPFMKKYQLVYDLDRKIIGMYKQKKVGDEGSLNNNNNSIFFIYIGIISALIIVVAGLVIYIIFLVKKRRKIKAFELDDDNFDYIPTK